MTIYTIIFIAQFEPTPDTPDFYERANDKKPSPVKAENEKNPEYEIERLVNKGLVKKQTTVFN